jgi:glycosyltransferase involved in cell wall biosynthesis
MDDLISVIVSTYNRPDALDVALRSLSRQSDRRFEIVVADDGSGAATERVVADWAARAPIAVKHVWHEDCGFRLAEIRNLGIRNSAGRYLVFLDGDCIARPSFVAAHRRLAEPGWFVTGNRILMSQRLTEQALAKIPTETRPARPEPELFGFSAHLALRARGDLNRLAPLLALPLGGLRKRRATQWRGANGSNMAFWRADLEAVDGFDAAFTGWGREDSDLFVRLIRAGVCRKDGRFATGVLHLWHREADRSGLDTNERRLAEIIGGDGVKARRGLSWREEATPSDAVSNSVSDAFSSEVGR